jgi:hypothetical protein
MFISKMMCAVKFKISDVSTDLKEIELAAKKIPAKTVDYCISQQQDFSG